MQSETEANTPKVSIVIPCYNSERTILGCLNGLLDQDYPSYEIMVVDDHSHDDTVEILKTIAGIQLLTNETNYGPAYCRNEAIKRSKGEIILLIDSDCLIDDKNLISKHVWAHRDPSIHILGGGVRGIGCGFIAKADNYSHWFLNIPYSVNKVGSHLTTNNMSVKRYVFEALGYFNVHLRTGEDTDFCERAIKAGYKLGLRTDAVIKHHDREKLQDFLKCFYLVGLDRIPTRRQERHRYWYLLPFDFFSSLVYCLPLSLLLTLQIMLAWFPYDKKVVFYFPFIFMGRLAMTIGIAHYYFLQHSNHRQELLKYPFYFKKNGERQKEKKF